MIQWSVEFSSLNSTEIAYSFKYIMGYITVFSYSNKHMKQVKKLHFKAEPRKIHSYVVQTTQLQKFLLYCIRLTGIEILTITANPKTTQELLE